MAGDATIRMHAPVVRDGGVADRVAVEEPLEIRVGGEPLAITMRTPGHDEELAVGFLHGEGLLAGAVRRVGPTPDLVANVVEVDADLTERPQARRFYTTSSCGVCGRGALEQVAVHAEPLPPGPVVPRALLAALPDGLRQPGFEVTGGLHATGLFDADGTLRCVREDVGRHNAMDKVVGRALLAALPDGLRQPGFEVTGGLHATGLFDADGTLRCVREDVGRHNAMDKVVGRALLDGELPLHGRLLCVSGRLSFELVQKAAVAGCPILVGVGAPSSLAVELAADRGMTLCGFARGGRVNVYSGAERVAG
jgi:FdhD protein